MKKIFTLIAFVGVFGFCANAQKTEVTKVQTTDKAVAFDGVIDTDEPWGETWLDIALTKDPAQANDADYTSKFQIFNNEKSILVAVVVEDNTQDGTAANSYERDNIEIFFNMDPTYKEKAYQAGIWQFRAQRIEDETINSGKGLGYFDGTNKGDGGIVALINDADFKFAIDNTSDGYTIEIAFPKAALTQTANFDGKNFNFDLQVANAVDGKRTGQHYWGNNSVNPWQDASTFSPIEIV